ncbi:unnamed protein product [Ostreobium quekettii]|uniref:Uncharacterized protein n=1 Tax=Ostreobium quekettii TaxID=121088 RepID=A0A8S1IP56_9CHLO|nr:unnamed protein product [Ostreobium quekettii]
MQSMRCMSDEFICASGDNVSESCCPTPQHLVLNVLVALSIFWCNEKLGLLSNSRCVALLWVHGYQLIGQGVHSALLQADVDSFVASCAKLYWQTIVQTIM